MGETGRGHLKIFFSYADSVGKKQAMLEAAMTAKARGVDVLVGFLTPHVPEKVSAGAKELEALPPLQMDGREEFDCFHEMVPGAFSVESSLGQRFPDFLVHGPLYVSRHFSWHLKSRKNKT